VISRDYKNLKSSRSTKSNPKRGIPAERLPSGNGSLEIVKILLDKGADVNTKDNYGSTALMMASRDGRIEVVKLLLSKKADANAKDEDGDTALIKATNEGNTEMMDLLKSHGAKE
jgi:ankyrin repeat protein